MSDTPPNDPRFDQRFDAYIAVANDQMTRDSAPAVATSAAYAAARLSVWAVLVNTDTVAQLESRKDQAFESFIAGYRAMLEEHWDEVRKNYDQYRPAIPGVITR